MPDRPSVLLLAPLGPARTGNGLAMRAGMLVEALTAVAAVHLFNHWTHHRGQLTTLMKQAGVDPGVTDMPWLPGVVRIID